MNKYKTTLAITAVILILSCCSNNHYNSANFKTKILGHRAYGIKGYNDTLMDNTLPAIIKSIKITNGVEVDIQMSKDGTIWLYHDTQIRSADSAIYFIPNLTDKEVKTYLSIANPYVQFNTLDELFNYFEKNQIDKYISLDIKSFYNEECFENNEKLSSYMYKIGGEIISLTNQYGLEDYILIESDIKYLLDFFRDNSNIRTYLLGFTNFNNHVQIAKQKKYTGVSHHFSDSEINKTSITYAHQKKLQIQLWTPNSEDDLISVLKLNPDFIQTDNVNYFKDSLNVE